MNLEQKLTEEIKNAMKSGAKPRLMALRALKAAITNERTRHEGELPEQEALKVIASHRKKMAGAKEQYQSAERHEMVTQADVEIAVCDEFLPEKLSTEQLTKIVDTVIDKTGASSKSDLGKVMGLLMKELAGKADGNQVRMLAMSRLEE
ncbi:MAG: GatB/YqeY domain-containing protein [Candidatus Electryonea clarkiae]|nr:GatB/YqeY domain-containing protein [Candidatus Electryonea clarkiae]MDP8286750.1 GatB/YqeY domain-containing protein [Candidatus Electryonea clarkiae]